MDGARSAHPQFGCVDGNLPPATRSLAVSVKAWPPAHGVARSRNRSTYESWLAGLLRDCAVLDITEPTTHCYAEIVLELKRKGQAIPSNDIWIAALCRQHSFPLLSRDRHFDLVAGNKRVGW